MIVSIAGGGLASGSATAVTFAPQGLATHGSMLYVSDGSRNVVWQIDLSTSEASVLTGDGTSGYSGDGDAATSAQLNDPVGLATDSAGDVFIADSGNNAVREVDASTGDISTIAGDGLADYTGDGGPATSAELDDPTGVAVNSSGDVFIADSNNSVLREVNGSGVIDTVAGTGGCTGTLQGIGGAATSAELCSPVAVAMDGTDVLVSDTSNRSVDSFDGTDLTLVAGTGSSGDSGDGGPATSAKLEKPVGVAVDATGNVYIADSSAGNIRKVDTSGDISTLKSGLTINSVTTDSSGTLYASNGNNIDTVASDGTTTVVAGNGNGDSGPASAALISPLSLAVRSDGTVYLTEGTDVRHIDSAGDISTAWSDVDAYEWQMGVGPDGALTLEGIYPFDQFHVAPDGTQTEYYCDPEEEAGGVVAAGNGDSYVMVNGDEICDVSSDATVTGSGSLAYGDYQGLALGPDGDLWTMGREEIHQDGQWSDGPLDLIKINSRGDATIVASDLPGSDTSYCGEGSYDCSLALDADGDVFFLDQTDYVYERLADGTIETIAGTGDATSTGDNGPAVDASTDATSLALDPSGNLYLAEPDRVRMIADAAPSGGVFPDHGPKVQSVYDAYPSTGVGAAEAPGPVNPAEACPCDQGQATGHPVNTATGDFWHTFTDLTTPGRGPGLALTRTYESQNADLDGLFGYGWSSSYGMSITASEASDTLTVNQENGSTVTFTDNGDGTYSPIQSRELATLVLNTDGSYTFTRRNRQIFTFNANGQLTGLSDLNGNTTSLSYDGNGNLDSVTDSSGRSYAVDTTNGRITSVTDPASRVYTYAYDSSGNLTSATDPTGAEWTFTYDSQHQMLTMLDPDQQGATNPSPVTNTYDTSGRVTSQTDFAGRTTTFDYSSISGATKVTSPAGNVTVDYYDNGLRTQTTVGYGTSAAASTAYTYDPTTEAIASVTDPNDNTTSYTYDSDGNELTVTDALSRTTTNTYDSLDDLLTSTDPAGVATTNTYDSNGNLTSRSAPLLSSTGTVLDTATISYTYGDSTHPGDITAVTDPDDNTTTYTYDDYGDLASVTDPSTAENNDGDETTYAYDTDTGERTSMVAPLGNVTGNDPADYTTSYAYDLDGRVTRVRDPLWSSSHPTQHETLTTYDADGNVATRTDGDGNTTTYTYDADSELTDTSLPDGSDVTQTWTDDGMLATVTHGTGHTTTYTYGARDLLTASTDALGQTTNYSYDGDGNLVLQAEPGATCTGDNPTAGCTSFDYDDANQLTAKHYLDGVTPDVTDISYDLDGRLTGETDTTGTSSNTYDSLGRLTTSTDGHGTATSYGYDLNGNLTTVSYPGTGHTATDTYDADNRLASVSDWSSNTVSFGYDPDGNLATTTWPSGTGEVDSADYNHADLPTQVNDDEGTSTLASFTYDYNDNNLLDSTTTTGISDPDQDYTYNTVQELTQSGPTASPTSYAYDSSDDLVTRASSSSSTISQAFDDDSQLCWTSATSVSEPACASAPSGATSYSYNAEGDRTAMTPATGNPTSYGYDEAQQLTSYTDPASTTTDYTYDGTGLRASTSSGGTTNYDTWDRAASLPMLLSDGNNDFLYGPGGIPIEQIDSSGTVTFLHTDQAGSVRLLTDTSGTTVGTYSYDPWGQTTSHTGTGSTPLGYDGQYTDPESGLIYLRARYYDPATTQFLTLDPAITITGIPYAYTNGDPLDNSDINGMCWSLLQWLCDAATAPLVTPQAYVRHKWYYDHPAATIGIGAGFVALGATGVGVGADLVGGAGLGAEAAGAGTAAAEGIGTLDTVALATGAGATALDAGPCFHGEHTACAGMTLGAAGIGWGAAGGILSIRGASVGGAIGESMQGAKTGLGITSLLWGGFGTLADVLGAGKSSVESQNSPCPSH